jgi:Icc protein
MPSDTTFIQLSDTHIAPVGELAHQADTAANFREVIALVQENAIKPEFVIISGDLCNEGDVEGYKHLKVLLGEAESLGVPVLLGLGNHDNRINFRRVILDEAEVQEHTPYYYSRRFGDLRVIMLDSSVPGQIHGEIDAEQMAWLEAELDEPAPGGDLVVLHHPCVPHGAPNPIDNLLLKNVEPFADVIERHPNVIGVLAGHSHLSSVAAFAGTVQVTAPATAFLLDATQFHDSMRMVEGAGFNICNVRDKKLLINPIVLPGDQTEITRHDFDTMAKVIERYTAARA